MSDKISRAQADECIREHRFSELFIDLGWDKENLPQEPLALKLQDQTEFRIDRVVEKRGFVVCVCEAENNYPENKSDRKRLVTQLARHHYEHLLIICGEGRQCWTVAIRPQNRPLRTVEVEWNESQDTQPIMEKLDGLVFEISEEEGMVIIDVVDKVRTAFMENAENITKKFYTKFQRELAAFSDFINGIHDQVSREWYAALMLNRLMFIYFIQKKKFLNGDVHYLQTRLRETQEKYGADEFHPRFYRHFLRRLFSEGLGAPEARRETELKAMLGRVPYLNGGLFDLHAIERENRDIDIPDEAFEKLFAFFGEYNWHLDTRATASGKDINPDVIGYIFEKYINDRAAMGAYYTREDITGYITRNTVIPFLLHRAKEKCKNAFDPENGIWRFLRENPDNYIYDAVKKGCDIPDEEIPENIRCGMDAKAPDLIKRRKDWNTKTEDRFALPTEIWRETMARRKRYFELKAKIKTGGICDIDDLITCNLDIERFASDALQEYEGSDFIVAFYEAVAGRRWGLKSNQKSKRGITILDPACGSGAFLFAALNILEPLYEICIERMRDFVAEDDKPKEQGKRKGGRNHPLFREVLTEIASHRNEKYWIYKTIILNNLYGVDLMKEAAEIAKLRLFLKLAAEAEYQPDNANLGLDPLPDIDFNIRSGNSLVGFVSMAQFEKAVSEDPQTGQRRMDYSHLTKEIREQAGLVQKANDRFRKAQDGGSEEYQKAKQDLTQRLGELNDGMNCYLAEQYGKQKEKDYHPWLKSHQPFNWVAEFYGIVEQDGGFDVVIGNPPYVEYSKVRKSYTIKDYKTETCGNLYAMFIERAMNLTTGPMGMIVQLSLICTDRMSPAQKLFKNRKSWFANFDDRPGKLFADLQHIRATIFISMRDNEQTTNIKATYYQRWHSENRDILFHQVAYGEITNSCMEDAFPKIGETTGEKLLYKLNTRKEKILYKKTGEAFCCFHDTPQYWIRATDFVPYFWNERDGEKQSDHVKNLGFENGDQAIAECALLNSSLFYWWFIVYSSCRNVNTREIENFPFNPSQLEKQKMRELSGAVQELMESYRENAVRKETNYATTGKVFYDEFYPRYSKSIIDKIDHILAKHYDLTEEELDYIINYDIKYRMGINE